ncbi:MAG: hypothetical protein QOD57_1143 [Actinomycetota bacterium]|jgi:hypothetical protein|nr:hypothetical protein [Actinomycetota bacterium]
MAHPRRLHRLPVLILLAAGLGAGVACSGPGSGSPNGVASVKTTAGKSAGPDAAAEKDKTKTNPEDAMLAFARCMRDHGVNVPDPDTSGGGPGVVTFSAAAPGEALDIDTSKFQEADKACRDLLGDAGPQNMSPQQQQEAQDQALAFSRCMREHGVNMPDPTFGGQGQVTMKLDKDSGLDPSDPKFEAAQQACGSAFGPGGGKGGPGMSVSGKADGGKGGGPSSGAVFSVGGAPSASSGGAK